MVNKIILLTALSALSANVSAGVITSVFDSSWTDMTNGSGEDITDFTSSSYVNPGWGGQQFDAEYLFYKLDGNMLSIGLQTGFDIVTGSQDYDGRRYDAGDLALSFNGVVKGDSSTYEYAVDFGFNTKDYYGGDTGTHTAGLYSVLNWNDNIYFDGINSSKDSSAPFAMSSGNILDTGYFKSDSDSQTVGGLMSYYQVATFDVSGLDITQLDVHWTMSCGNDAIDGYATVPEPSSLLLMSAGFMGLFGSLVARRKRKVS